jgi:NodT family efflux transporter outer membrane factor (OMF) lipoprotein
MKPTDLLAAPDPKGTPSRLRNDSLPSRDRQGAVVLTEFGRRVAFTVAWAIITTGCMVGPKYKRPSAPVTAAYKEPPPPEFFKEWKQATPMEGVLRGKWWEIYKDPALNALEEQVAISNQNVLMAEAQFREARAAIKVARSNLFPTLTTSPSASFSAASSSLGTGQVSSAGTVSGGGVRQLYNWPFDLTWQLDLWGGIRRTVSAATNTAQASAAQLENARLSYQAELAQDYFSMHGLDATKKLLEQSVNLYTEYVDLTKLQFQQGVASQADVALAQTQLESTRAQMIGVGVQRAQYEHAIAILTGKPPAEMTIPETPWTTPPPPVPVGLPSQLLERRPDIAVAERQVAAANEQIGVAKAAYYPTLTLSGSGGFESSSIVHWLSWPARFWALGPQLAETLLDFGKRRGTVQESEAAYDAAVANYRQTVLTAFQQVEDNLAALRILGEQAGAEQRAIGAAGTSLDITTDQYKQGVADYLQVITAQTALLTDQVTAIGILSNRMLASVQLVEALGGGWDASQLPSPQDLRSNSASNSPTVLASQPH